MILVVTCKDVSQVTGGLERAAKKLGSWLESIDSVRFYTAKGLLMDRKLSRNCEILLVGHRSIGLLVFAFYCSIMKRQFSWCPFWHDYNLEQKKGLRFRLYDILFKVALSFSKNHFVVSNYEKKNTVTNASQHIVRLPGFIESDDKGDSFSINRERSIDMLFVGRDVPHKQRSFANQIACKLDLNYVEIIAGEDFISDEKLAEVYRNTKVVFIPSKYESYSLVAVEALLAGAVVVAFPNVQVGEALVDVSRFIVTPDHLDVATERVSLALAEWTGVSDSELDSIADHFSNETCKKIFLNCFSKDKY